MPKDKGGDDSFENAIALCFDCHADAGHYFDGHPKGSKFSPEELVKHKIAWFSIVQENNISPFKIKELLNPGLLAVPIFYLVSYLKSNDIRFNLFSPFRNAANNWMTVFKETTNTVEKCLMVLIFVASYFLVVYCITRLVNKLLYNKLLTSLIIAIFVFIDIKFYNLSMVPSIYCFLLAYIPIFLLVSYFYYILTRNEL